MSVSGPEQVVEPEPFNGRPLETAVALGRGIVSNFQGLRQGLKEPEADIGELMKENGYTLIADISTAARAALIPYVTYVFNKPPEKRTKTDAAVVALAWASDKFDGIMTGKANRKSHYGSPADKDVDHAMWLAPSIIQTARGEMSPIVSGGIAMRDLLVERERAEATHYGDITAQKAKQAGRLKATFMALDQVFSASPAGAKHPKVREGLHWTSLAASWASGILTVAEVESGIRSLNYDELSPVSRVRLGVTALGRQVKRPDPEQP